MDNSQLMRNIIKEALVEVLEERQDLLSSAIEAALEDIALVRAIQEGSQSELVPREEVFSVLEGRP